MFSSVLYSLRFDIPLGRAEDYMFVTTFANDHKVCMVILYSMKRREYQYCVCTTISNTGIYQDIAYQTVCIHFMFSFDLFR